MIFIFNPRVCLIHRESSSSVPTWPLHHKPIHVNLTHCADGNRSTLLLTGTRDFFFFSIMNTPVHPLPQWSQWVRSHLNNENDTNYVQQTQESNERPANHCYWLHVYPLRKSVTIRPTVSSRREPSERRPVGIITALPLKCFCFPPVSPSVVVLLTVLFCIPALCRWILMSSILMASTKLLLWMLIRSLICIRLSVKFPHKSSQLR